jgi:glycosyltransferase involved in cell wall biosynthesis
VKIYLFDPWKYKFTRPLIAHWEKQGHEVEHGMWWGPDRVEGRDVAMFYACENNIKQASLTSEKPPDTRVIVEAVDADIYARTFRKVNWDYVDTLVSMSQHMIDYMRPHLPDTLDVRHVPGGVDLDLWTMRREPERNYNIAWVGRYWIGKNVFGAFQILHELLLRDGDNPWRLYVRGKGWDPAWWEMHCKAYLKANPILTDRVTFVEEWIPDLNEWLEDKSYILSTSFKEAFGYAIAEAAAKGLRPVIQNSYGTLDIWPREWVFDTHSQAVRMFLDEDTRPQEYRAVIEQCYPLAQRLALLDEICFGGL